MSDLIDKLEGINDRESFFGFVQALIDDREDEVRKEKLLSSNQYGSGHNGWENDTIEGFLESALAWAKTTNMGESQGLSEEASWKAFAEFLYCGKSYE